jgi:hypothetical protein
VPFTSAAFSGVASCAKTTPAKISMATAVDKLWRVVMFIIE